MSGVLSIEKTVAITVDKVSLVWLPDGSPDTEGCRAFAYVSYPARGRERRSEWFASVGVWGMPSDIPEDARKEIEQQQLSDLKQHLSVFGIDVSGFDNKPVEGRDYS